MTEHACDHRNPVRLEWPGGYASMTVRGSWTAYFEDRPGEVFCITTCPVCLVPLQSRRPGAKPDLHNPAVAHSQFARRRPE